VPEQETLWYLGGQRIISTLGERCGGTLRLMEFATPAETFIYAHRSQEDEAHYVMAGAATFACDGQVFHPSAGAFLFLPCNVPYQLAVSAAGPLHYLSWMMPAGFAQDVIKMGNPHQALLLAPPPAPAPAKVQHLADLLRGLVP
jgi:mannose-6-phosphate isomerase-like protein (cupin superfamily)